MVCEDCGVEHCEDPVADADLAALGRAELDAAGKWRLAYHLFRLQGLLRRIRVDGCGAWRHARRERWA